MTTFQELGLSNPTLKALKKKGFEEATPIQEKCIPLLLNGEKDIIGQAQTGTGKTAAFGIPVIEKTTARKKNVQALILTPTRELAIQVAEEIGSLKGEKKLELALLYGGASIGQQLGKLRSGAHIVVGTPGRVIDHINRGSLKLDKLDFFVLDEADEMLNMGFLDDIELVLKACPEQKQMLFFSATMPDDILKVAKTYMRDFDIVKTKNQQLTTGNTEQIYVEVRERDKLEALSRIIDAESNFYAIIFCRTKRQCDQLSQSLQNRGYLADALHGDMNQRQRETILDKFKKQNITMLVATDVAARGIDVNDITHVVNYHIPSDPESYTHRIGRTGRAGKQGIAITLVTPAEYRRLVVIKKVTKTDIKKQAVPSIEEVKKAKVENVKQAIKETTNSELDHYQDFANELLKEYDQNKLTASLLKLAFQEYLQQNNYRNIEEVKIDKDMKTRLFIAQGREHGFHGPRDLVEWIKKETKVQDKDINDVVVLDGFSFITCTFETAEHIMYVINKKPGRNIIKKARERDDKGGRPSRSRSSRGGDRRNYRDNKSNDRGGRNDRRSRR